MRDLRRDIEVTRAVCEPFTDCGLLVDANDAHTVEEAMQYVQADPRRFASHVGW